MWAMIVVLLLLLLAKDDQCWKTQVCSFSYLSYKVHNNYIIIIIGIYTHAAFCYVYINCMPIMGMER